MTDLVSGILNTLSNIIKYLTQIINTILALIKNIIVWINYSIQVITAIVPTTIIALLVLSITIGFVLFLIGRGD